MFFSGKSSDYATTLRIAQEAVLYARSVILKGSSQIENNDLEPHYFQHLLRGVEGVRYTQSKEIGMRDILNDEIVNRVKNGESDMLAMYNSVIEVSKKYSLGNCYELTFQALDYILNKYPEMPAEVYKLANLNELDDGIHAFLVLNRDPKSSMFEPETWGENAIICDPWAKDVYLAKQYLNRLRGSDTDPTENRTVPYDSKKHVIMPFENYNTWTIREEIRKEAIKQENKPVGKKPH